MAQRKPAGTPDGGSRPRARSAAGRSDGGSHESTPPAAPGRMIKWIDTAGVAADRPGQSLATRSHEVIRHWAELRGAKPATAPSGTRTPSLRLEFPGWPRDDLHLVDWEEWFGAFDAAGLVFLFQDHKKDGSRSNYFRVDRPTRAGRPDDPAA